MITRCLHFTSSLVLYKQKLSSMSLFKELHAETINILSSKVSQKRSRTNEIERKQLWQKFSTRKPKNNN